MKTARLLLLSAVLAAVSAAWADPSPAAADTSAPAVVAAEAAPASPAAEPDSARAVPQAADSAAAAAPEAPAPDSAAAVAAPADDGRPAAGEDDFAGKTLLFEPRIGEDLADRDGLRFVLVYEAEKRHGANLRTRLEACDALQCAREIGEAAKASRAIVAQARRLGSKNFLVLSSVELADGSTRSVREAFSGPEEFETAVRRAFDALEAPEGAEKPAASVGDVVSSDGPDGRFRRSAERYFGLKFGMMYPLFDTYDWIEVGNGGVEERKIDVTQWEFGVSYWIFVSPGWGATLDLALRGPNSGPDRYQFLFDAGAVRVFTADDVSPFVGLGVGLQAGPEDEYENELTNRHMGFSLNANAGLFFLRTYNFSFFLRGLYGIILNDDLDQKFAADFGILLHASNVERATPAKAASASTDANALQKGKTNAGWAVLGIVFALLLLAVAAD